MSSTVGRLFEQPILNLLRKTPDINVAGTYSDYHVGVAAV